jgi:hypothetical protein
MAQIDARLTPDMALAIGIICAICEWWVSASSTQQRRQVFNRRNVDSMLICHGAVSKSGVLICGFAPRGDLSLQNCGYLALAQGSARRLSGCSGSAFSLFQRDGASVVDRRHHTAQGANCLEISFDQGGA